MKRPAILNDLRAAVALLAWLWGWECQATDLPSIGKIELYGLRTVTEKEVRAKIHLKAGDPIPMEFRSSRVVPEDEKREALGLGPNDAVPQDKAKIEQDLATIPNVRRASLASVCCEPDGTTTLFVGIEETGTRPFSYRELTGEDLRLPEEMIHTYDRFIEAVMDGVKNGNFKEDQTQGHALFSGEAIRPLQDKFLVFARQNASLLRQVLAGSKDPKHRAVAATILPYHPDKASVAPDLVSAVRDPDEAVRNNSIRALGVMLPVLARRPEGRIPIAPDPFVQMLESVSWSDRNKAMMVLLELVKGSEAVRSKLREQAMPALVEMARWKDTHSLMALQLIGRITGKDDDAVADAWKNGQRETILKEALGQSSPSQAQP